MKFKLYLAAVVVLLISQAQSFGQQKVLFIHDNLHTHNKIYMNTIREELKSAQLSFDERDLSQKDNAQQNLSQYEYILAYLEVKMFGIPKHIWNFITESQNLENKKFSVLVTAKIAKKQCQKMADQFSSRIKSKNGIVADAVTSATRSMTEQEKMDMTKKFTAEFVSSIQK